MKLPVPGPGELVGALRELTRTLAGVAPGLTRALALVPRTEELLTRIDAVVSDIEATGDRAKSLLGRTEDLLATYKGPLRELAPTVGRLAETLEPAEVEAAVSLVDRLPGLLDAVDRDVLPVLAQLRAVGPDVHELLDIVDDVRRLLADLPGVGMLRRDG
jgi:ABC-type transporter Mla subunit MlaD